LLQKPKNKDGVAKFGKVLNVDKKRQEDVEPDYTAIIYLIKSRKPIYIRSEYEKEVGTKYCKLKIMSINSLDDNVPNALCKNFIIDNNSAKTHCAFQDFVENQNAYYWIKMQDDVFPNYENLCNYLVNRPYLKNLMIGKLNDDKLIIKDEKHKNFDASDLNWGLENSRRIYPPFIGGSFQIIASHLVHRLYGIWNADKKHYLAKINDDTSIGMTLYQHKIQTNIVNLPGMAEHPENMARDFIAYHTTWGRPERFGIMDIFCEKDKEFVERERIERERQEERDRVDRENQRLEREKKERKQQEKDKQEKEQKEKQEKEKHEKEQKENQEKEKLEKENLEKEQKQKQQILKIWVSLNSLTSKVDISKCKDVDDIKLEIRNNPELSILLDKKLFNLYYNGTLLTPEMTIENFIQLDKESKNTITIKILKTV